MMRGICTSTRRRVIVAMAALGMAAPAASAEGATYWTIRPDNRAPLLSIGLGPEGLRDGHPTVWPVLEVPRAGAFDQHWSFRKSGHGYMIVNRQSGQCWNAPVPGINPATVIMSRCIFDTMRFTFHRPGFPQPVNPGLSSFRLFQLRNSRRRGGEEEYGRCIGSSFNQVGIRLTSHPCSTAANQKWVLARFTAP